MPKDRSLDRHARPAHVIRFDPPELWTRLAERVGERKCGPTINELVRRYLDGEPMPK